MQTTMNLLEIALKQQPAPYWHERLNLSRNALHNAKIRGHISPAIAGALAEELGQDVKAWIVVAALESERDSACKTRMLKKLPKLTSLYGCKAHLPRRSKRCMWSRMHGTLIPSMSANTACVYQPLRQAATA